MNLNRTHLRWLIPLLLVIVLLAGVGLFGWWRASVQSTPVPTSLAGEPSLLAQIAQSEYMARTIRCLAGFQPGAGLAHVAGRWGPAA
jgi:hypothetical protein